MPELRIDPLSGLRTIVADERADRPGGGFEVEPRMPIDPQADPFLEGHEDRTPPELYAERPQGGPDGPGWRVRVVPNLYPALGATAGGVGDDPLLSDRADAELFSARPATGAHEVIVNSPRAVSSLADLTREELTVAMSAWRTRLAHHGQAECRHLIVNEGTGGGASVPHTHAQLYALPFVPAQIARERERFTAHAHRTHGRNLLEDVIQAEVRDGSRLVAVDPEAVAISPFAARVPFQLMLAPRRPAARFEDDGPLGADLLHDLLERLGRALGGVPAMNLWVRTAPSGADHFCWRIDLVPRLTALAGLELGTGLALNPVAPERAAEQLRAAG